MKSKIGAFFAASALVGSFAASQAFAGGFQRGTADTDILFERSGFAARAGLSYVNPQRGFESIEGVSGDYGDYTGEYNLPSFAVAFGSDIFGCAGTYTESFAAEADYTGAEGGALPFPKGNFFGARTRNLEFESDEFGATCRVSYNSDRGIFSLLGGIFFEDFEFEGSSLSNRNLTSLGEAALGRSLGGTQLVLPTAVGVEAKGDYEMGYRVGLAYEIPEIALRVQALYRSELTHDSIAGTASVVTDSAFVRLPDGTQVPVPVFLGQLGIPPQAAAGLIPAAGTSITGVSSLNEVTSPQSLTINAQTGIAAGTLLLASFRWTDWSTNEEVIVSVDTAAGGSQSIRPYNWRDGYTASVGIGRAFNEMVSGAVSVGFDRGVSTGSETTYTDLYTLSGGVALRPTEGFGEIRLGGLVGYWTDGEQSVEDGANFDARVGDDFVYGLSASLKIAF